jgi:hypothetical protein
LTHHHPDFIEKVTRINTYRVELFSHFHAKLKATADGGALSDGNGHSSGNLPLPVAGHAGGLRGGRHGAAPAKTPMANLFIDTMGRVRR